MRDTKPRATRRKPYLGMWIMVGLAAGCASSHGKEAAPEARAKPADDTIVGDAPRLSSEPGDAPIREPEPDPTAVVLAWDDEAEDGELDALHLSVRNTLAQPVAFDLGLLALAPTQLKQSATVDRFELAPHETRMLYVPRDAVPVQSVGSPTGLVAVANYSIEGRAGSAATMPLHVAFRRDYSALSVVAEGATLGHIPAGNAAQDNLLLLSDAFRSKPLGRYRDESGVFHELTASDADEGVSFSTSGVVLGGLDSFEALRALSKTNQAEQTTAHNQKAVRSTKICFDWSGVYVDRNQGEDYLIGGTGFESVSNDAAYASYFVLDTTSGTMVSPSSAPQLNDIGCTPSMSLTVGHQFLFVAITQLIGPNGVNFAIRDNSATPDYRWYGGSFTLTSSTSSTVKLASTVDEGTNVAAVATRMYQMTPDAPPTSLYLVSSKEGCLGNPDDASGCASGIQVYLGTDPNGTSVTLWKYIIAHELGHVVQGVLTGTWQFSYDASGQTALCGCTQVVDTRNRAHCLNSAEFTSAAMSEGFAQFWAARLFNAANENNCTFVYYKEFPVPGFGIAVPPPVPFSCTAPTRWYEGYCTQFTGMGSEIDWMGFFWNINTAGNRLTLTDIANVYKRACGGGTCLNKQAPVPALLKLAARGEFGVNSAKDQHFEQALTTYGVDH